MCGISAIVALESISESRIRTEGYVRDLRRRLEKSLQYINHRGPDASNQWISDDHRVALGHVRLAINDLSPAGIQPFHDKQNQIHVVVNGEFYEHENIREELGDEYEFQSQSDSEIVIALYIRYGIHALSRLRGEFALCLYDSRRQLFYAIRDRYGVKPLFWTVVNGRLFLASEAKAFLPLGWKPEWDVRSIMEDAWLHDTRTLFKGVRKIRPGHYLICTSFGHMEERIYWDVDFPKKQNIETRSSQDMIIGLREQMLEAVRIRLRADVPIGVYLSGGIDSAVIAGMAAHVLREDKSFAGQDASKRLTCFGIGFEEDTEFDEMPIARRTAESLGLHFVSKRMDEDILSSRFEDATYHFEHHNPDLNSVGKFALSELPQAHGYKVVLSGEGSDEHLGGYGHFMPDYLREPDPAWTEQTLSASRKLVLASQHERDPPPGYAGTDRRFTDRKAETPRRMMNDTSIASRLWVVTMAHFAPWTKCYGDVDVQETRANNPDARVLEMINSKWHPLHTSEYLWIKSILPNLILTSMGDRMEMAHSIEGRPPFLDHVLTEYINRIPPTLKIRYDASTGEFTEKWILREAARPFVTDEVYRRHKHAFTAPISYPTNGRLHQLLARLITQENVEQLGFVDWSKIRNMVDMAFGNSRDQSSLRYAFVVAQWVVLSKRFRVKKATPPEKKRARRIIESSRTLRDSKRLKVEVSA